MVTPKIRVTKNVIVEILGQVVTLENNNNGDRVVIKANELDAEERVISFLDKSDPNIVNELSKWINTNVIYTTKYWYLYL